MTIPRRHWFALSGTMLLLGASAGFGPHQALAQDNPDLDRISSSPIPPPEERALADGQRPLTQEMIDRFRLFIEWALDVQTTQEQRHELKQCMVAAWKTHDPATITSAMQIVNAQKMIERKSAAERDLLRQQVQPGLIKTLHENTSPEGRWMLSLYDSAHKTLAPGNPPLTRQISDAYLEVLVFMRNEVFGTKELTANKEAKERFVKPLKQAWAQSDAVRRKHFASMPMVWAAIRVEWPNLPESQRAPYRAQFRSYLQAMAPEWMKPIPHPQPVQQARAQGGGRRMSSNEAYARAMADLQSSHNSFVFMSNLSTMHHVGMMNSISNIGGGGWHYEYKYR